MDSQLLHGLARGSEGWSSKSPGSGSTSLDLILLNTSTGAQCLDGSPSGFYLGVGMTTEQVVEDNQDGRGDWVVYLQGGGLCIEPIDCLQRAKTRLGSSTRWPRRITHVSDGGEDILSSDKWNPFASAKQLALEPARMFPPPTCRLVDRSSFTSAGWQKVLIPYGSGDTYVGTQRTPNAFGVYFAGHLQVEATFAHLLRHTRFRLARSVLLCGGSAGGIGTFQHANWLAGLLDAEGMTTTTFKASPQAGAFFVSQDLVLMGEFELDVRVNAAALATEYLYHFFGGSTVFLDPSCTRAVPSHPHRCWSAAVHYPHISPPLYLAQNRYDRSQVQAWKMEPNEPQAGDILGAEWWPLPLAPQQRAVLKQRFLRYFGRETLDGIVQLAQHRPKANTSGLFVPSCYAHTDNLCLRGGSRVRNTSYAASLYDWFHGIGHVPHVLVEQCAGPDPCNPQCSC